MKLSPAARREYERKRNARHRHNGFIGSARWIISATDSIIRSETATARAQSTAREIHALALRLAIELRERDDGV